MFKESNSAVVSVAAATHRKLSPSTMKRRALGPEAVPNVSTLRQLNTLVINLDHREDRLHGCLERFEKHCPEIRGTRFRASNGREDVIPQSEVTSSWDTGRNVVYQKLRAIRKGWDDLDTYKVRQLALSPGERGCSMSHIRAWRHCLEHCGPEERPLLVLEDDAAPIEGSAGILVRALNSLPRDAHLLYLGYSQAAEWRRQVSPELVEAEYVWTTVGYIIWPAGARILLSKLPIDQPVDNWLGCMCASGDIKSYCVVPKLIHQADAWNVNSDVAHSDEHYWGPNSDIHHSDEFYWGPQANEPVEKRVFHLLDVSDDSEESTDDM